MSDNPYKKQDFLEVAKHQFAQISAEFDKALESFKDSERRKQMTASYLDMLQKGLSKAQDSVARYQEKMAASATAEPPGDQSAPDGTESEPPPSGTPST